MKLIERLNPDGFPRCRDASHDAFASSVGLSRDALAKLPAAHVLDDSKALSLLCGICETAPYLCGLMRQDPARALSLLDGDPDAAAAQVFNDLRDQQVAASKDAAGLSALASGARRAKSSIALLSALADLGGVWPVMRVTQVLSQLADITLTLGVRQLLQIATQKGQLLTDNPDAPEADAGYFVLAMGKHGAGELNYSSDVDLIVLYDRARMRLKDPDTAQAFFVRLTNDLVKFMTQRTADGYVFRTDLRLRPDPGATQVAMSTDAAHHYYEAFGQNWERAAMIKARPVAGDLEAGHTFLADLAPFVWRKYLDYASIADIHAMKRQIHAHRGFGSIKVIGHDVKVGRGGIREIEFFAQTQQLIAGGRQPDLRTPRTLNALTGLADREWITPEVRDDLTAAYCHLRTIEHRIQMMRDEQTQKLPANADEFAAFARFCGGEPETLEREIRTTFETVQRHYADLFENVPSLARDTANLVLAGEDDDPETLDALTGMGFSDPARAVSIVRSWHRGRYRATASPVARERLTELQPALLDAFAQTVDADSALIGFDRLLAQLPAGIQLFSMLRANPDLLRLIANVTGSAPRLARILARRRRVADALLDPRVMSEALPSADELEQVLGDDISSVDLFEERLDRARVFASEQAFLIGVRVLAGAIDAGEAGQAYARLAEVVVRQMQRVAADDIERAHGTVDGGEACVLAMGKLGGTEMTAASDLDLIVVYRSAEGASASDGPRPLEVTPYFTRFTQRLVTALSAPTAQGLLYEVDLRLRPSGQKGPVATRFVSFESYQTNEAWTWEHMALTRSRVISGPDALARDIGDVIGRCLRAPRDRQKTAEAVRDMRERIWNEKGKQSPWELKQARGGLIDLEFIAQFLQLVHAHHAPHILSTNTHAALMALDAEGLLGRHGERLCTASRLFDELTQILRLCFDGPFDPASAPDGLKDLICRVAQLPAFDAVEAHLRDQQAGVAEAYLDLVR